MTEFMDNALNYLRTTIVKAKCEKKLTRYIQHDGKSYNDGITTLDGYYVQLINTALAEIRRGRSDYVYSLEQVRDIMRFEPLISVRYIAFAGAYEIRKGAV